MPHTNLLHFRKSDYLLILLHKMGAFDFVRMLMPNVLTVLNYHRIDEPYSKGFDTFRPNISASPSEFAKQMDFVARNYHVISEAELVAFIRHGQKLPPRAALITFDDGYLDNYTIAYPILKARSLPAIIFLATDYIGVDKPFYWDLVAYCFHHTTKDYADLPHIGGKSWVDDLSRIRVMLAWIETLKRIPDTDRQKIVERLPDILGVGIGDDAFMGLTISWSQAREMNANGIGMGGHTVSHPILTRISLDDATLELSRSKQRIEEELKTPVFSFAYPNGQSTDFNNDIMTRVDQVGYKAAFTLLSGPTRHTTVVNHPFSIRRIFLSHEDNFSRFIAKLTGLPRVIQRW